MLSTSVFVLFIAAELFAELCGPTFEPYTVIRLELSFGAQLCNYVAGMIAQGGGQADYEGHKRSKHYVLQSVSVLMLQKTAAGVLVGNDEPAKIEATPVIAHFKTYAVAKTFGLLAGNEQNKAVEYATK